MTKPSPSPQAPWSRAKALRRVLTQIPEWAKDHIARLRAACHPKQLAAVDDFALYLTVLCARGGGKSTCAMVRLLITMMKKPRARCVFIAVTKEHATEIIWDKLKATVEKAGIEAIFNETKRTCTLVKNASVLKLAGADDKKEIDKLRGIPFDAVVIDEAASHLPQLLENLVDRVIGPRLGERDGWLMLIGTPGHILAGLFYDATRPGSDVHRPYEAMLDGDFGDDMETREVADRDDVVLDVPLWSSHSWSLEDGAAYVPAMAKLWAAALAKKKKKGWGDTHPVWVREYRGQWAADDTDNVFKFRPYIDGEAAAEMGVPDGTAWNVWEPELDKNGVAVLPERFKAFREILYVVAIDMGHKDPCAVNAFALSPTDPDQEILHVYCFEKAGFYARPLAQLLLGEDMDHQQPEGLFGALGGWPTGIVGDIDDAVLAEMANVYGVRMVQAKRRRELKIGAIELVNGDFVPGKIKIIKDSPLALQLATLQWQVDEFGVLKENKAQANHCTDTLVYGRQLIAVLFESGAIDDEEEKKRRQRERRERGEAGGLLDDTPERSEWSDFLAPGAYDEAPW